MATSYENLINNNGTISDTTTNKDYADPTQLAGDLGITADKIDWSKITSANPTEVTDTVKSNLLADQAKTDTDIANLISQKASDRQNYLDSLKPSAEVTQYQDQYADTEEQISGIENSRDKGILETGQQNIAMEYITGEQQAIEQRATAKLNVYNSKQKNILTRLGFAKEADALKQQTYKTLMDADNEDLEIQFKIQSRIDTNLKSYQDRVDKLSDVAREEVNNIASVFMQNGKEWNDLSVNERTALIQKAKNAGVDISLIQSGMKAAKDKFLYDQTRQEKQDAMDLRVQEANIAQSNASAAASGRSNRGTSGDSEKLTGLAAYLDTAANTVITAEKTGAPLSSGSYWSMVKQFSESTGISESDADKQIMNTIKQKKGEPINQNLGSDFATPITEAERRANAAKAGVSQKVVTAQVKAEDEAVIKSLVAKGMSETQARKVVIAGKTKLPDSKIGK